jgi:hypothetical protein
MALRQQVLKSSGKKMPGNLAFPGKYITWLKSASYSTATTAPPAVVFARAVTAAWAFAGLAGLQLLAWRCVGSALGMFDQIIRVVAARTAGHAWLASGQLIIDDQWNGLGALHYVAHYPAACL